MIFFFIGAGSIELPISYTTKKLSTFKRNENNILNEGMSNKYDGIDKSHGNHFVSSVY